MVAAILGAFGLLVGYFRGLKELFWDHDGRATMFVASLLILIGTVFYSMVEGWGLVDSFYFSVVTLTTVGYGDLSPDTTPAKLFTTIYIIMGLSVIANFASSIAKKRTQRTARRGRRNANDQAENIREGNRSNVE